MYLSPPPTPIPAFVATAALPTDAFERLRDAFVRVSEQPALSAAREALLLRRFAVVDGAAYSTLRARHDALIAAKELW